MRVVILMDVMDSPWERAPRSISTSTFQPLASDGGRGTQTYLVRPPGHRERQRRRQRLCDTAKGKRVETKAVPHDGRQRQAQVCLRESPKAAGPAGYRSPGGNHWPARRYPRPFLLSATPTQTEPRPTSTQPRPLEWSPTHRGGATQTGHTDPSPQKGRNLLLLASVVPQGS